MLNADLLAHAPTEVAACAPFRAGQVRDVEDLPRSGAWEYAHLLWSADGAWKLLLRQVQARPAF